MSDALARYQDAAVLAVGAHPDDLEVGAGGTLARLAAAGARVVLAVLSAPGEPVVRAAEARRAAAVLGCESRLLTTDGRRVEDLKSYEAVAALDALVAELRPRLIISHASCDYHQDHVLAGQAALAAQRRGHFDYWRFATTLRPLQGAPFEPRLYVDISPCIELKLEAIAAHESQFRRRGRGVGVFRELARARGREAGVDYAEAFELGRLILS